MRSSTRLARLGGVAANLGKALRRWGVMLLAIGSLGILPMLIGGPPNSDDLGAYLTLALWVVF